MVEELYREMFPTDEARRAFEREGLSKVPPMDPEEFEQWRDLKETDGAAQPDTGKERTYVTTKEQASLETRRLKEPVWTTR